MNRKNSQLVTAVTLLASKLYSTKKVIQQVGFEDGSGYKFCAQLFDLSTSTSSNVYFEVSNTSISKYIETAKAHLN